MKAVIEQTLQPTNQLASASYAFAECLLTQAYAPKLKAGAAEGKTLAEF